MSDLVVFAGGMLFTAMYIATLRFITALFGEEKK